jgi:signal transduction histidine kinase
MKLRQQLAIITTVTTTLLVTLLFILLSTMVSDSPQDVVPFAFKEELVRNTLIFLLIAGGTVLLVVIIAGERLITQPLIEMNRDAAAIESNPEEGRRICLRGGDELSSLGQSLNRMLDTLDSSRMQLMVARDEAEQANRSKSDFLAVVSHEIRTPLSGIIGMTELLEETVLDPEQKDLVNSLHTSINGLQDILNDLLDLSKIEAGKMELEPTPFSPQQLLDSTLAPYTIQSRRKGIELIYSVSPELPETVVADSHRLRQILLNLVVNAIKFTHKGFVKVTLSGKNTDHKTSAILLTVEDTGIGMTAEVCSRIFQPYTQADLATRREYGGTGLGLTITRRLAELMNGSISLKSQLGEGSVFTVEIPLSTDLDTQNSPVVTAG